jgi:hypothetical protein
VETDLVTGLHTELLGRLVVDDDTAGASAALSASPVMAGCAPKPRAAATSSSTTATCGTAAACSAASKVPVLAVTVSSPSMPSTPAA